MEEEYHQAYEQGAQIIQVIEGEAIQDLYLLLKNWKLDPEACDGNKGVLLPRCEDIQDMQDAISKLFRQRMK